MLTARLRELLAAGKAEALVFDSHAVWSTDEERTDAIARALAEAEAEGERAGFARGIEMCADIAFTIKRSSGMAKAQRIEDSIRALLPSPAPTASTSEQHCNGIMPGGGTSLACGLSGCICRCEICSPPATPPRATTEAGKEPGR